MPGARRRRQSGRHRAHDELFGPTAARSGGRSAGGADEPPASREPTAGSADLLRLAAQPKPRDRRRGRHYRGCSPLIRSTSKGVSVLRGCSSGRSGPIWRSPRSTPGWPNSRTAPSCCWPAAARMGGSGNYPAAEADLRRVVRLHPSHGPAQFELGLVLLRRGRAAEAAYTLGRAIAFGPESAHVYTHLAEALNQSGRVADAASALERALALDPPSRGPTICWGACSTGCNGRTKRRPCTAAHGSSTAGDRGSRRRSRLRPGGRDRPGRRRAPGAGHAGNGGARPTCGGALRRASPGIGSARGGRRGDHRGRRSRLPAGSARGDPRPCRRHRARDRAACPGVGLATGCRLGTRDDRGSARRGGRGTARAGGSGRAPGGHVPAGRARARPARIVVDREDERALVAAVVERRRG